MKTDLTLTNNLKQGQISDKNNQLSSQSTYKLVNIFLDQLRPEKSWQSRNLKND